MKQPFSPSFSVLLIAGMYAPLAGAETLTASAGPVEYHPAVTAFFESDDPFVQQVVLPNIEANRKSSAVLRVVAADGRPVAGVRVSAELQRHEFHFGHCDLATESDPAQRALLNNLFDYTSPGNVTKWRAYAAGPEENDFSRVDNLLAFCQERDIDVEWHFLSGYHPDWLADITPDSEKARFQLESARTVLRRYHDKVRYFQVFNEDWFTHISRAKVYGDQTAWFAELRREFPEAELGVCDCWSFNLESRLPGVEALKERYPGIDFIAMHAHRPRRLWASPGEMYDTYDPYLDSGIQIHVTEFGIIMGEITGDYRSGAWDEAKLAEYFVQALATAFSHQAVRVFQLWSNYEKFTGNPLFTEDGEPNEKYRAIQSLLQDKLTTRASGLTDPDGRLAFRGFHGAYDVTVTFASGKASTVRAEIGRDTTQVRLLVDEKAETVETVSPPGAP